jgi:hypothetical protein
MTETLDQKIEEYVISTALSNSSGRPFLRGKRDERKTWSTLHLVSAENAGWPKQGAIPAWLRRHDITQSTAVMAGADPSGVPITG